MENENIYNNVLDNTLSNTVVDYNNNINSYDLIYNVYIMLVLLNVVIITTFLYKYLKSLFGKR